MFWKNTPLAGMGMGGIGLAQEGMHFSQSKIVPEGSLKPKLGLEGATGLTKGFEDFVLC